ncbi:hypothetical protein [Pectobacterium brasiliense]|uniref:hypothetical protein n=1 Tax=Pectobacterium TaxID=122277 RepID=UPI0025A0C3B0|nr:hypothetical protein [Pectobacterium brasiliense]WJM82887.1 hypothetical protein QTI90_09135 [Pectobacterium brasiliense]
MIFNGDVFYRKTASIITTEQDGKGVPLACELFHLRATSLKLTAVSGLSAYDCNKIIKTLNIDAGEKINNLMTLREKSERCIKIEADSKYFNCNIYTDNQDSNAPKDRFSVQFIEKIEFNIFPIKTGCYFDEFSGYFQPMGCVDSSTKNPLILGFNFYVPEKDFSLLVDKVDKGYNSVTISLWIPCHPIYRELPDVVIDPNSEEKRLAFISSLNIEKNNFTIETGEVIENTPTVFDDEAEPTETDKKLRELTELSKKILTALTIIAACMVGFSLKTIF